MMARGRGGGGGGGVGGGSPSHRGVGCPRVRVDREARMVEIACWGLALWEV